MINSHVLLLLFANYEVSAYLIAYKRMGMGTRFQNLAIFRLSCPFEILKMYQFSSLKSACTCCYDDHDSPTQKKFKLVMQFLKLQGF